MTEKTLALVLRISPFSRTSNVVTWLTADFGRITTLMKGSCRPKSVFLGQCDLAYTCELVFYARGWNGVHIAKECAPLQTRSALRTDWRAAACASYVCDMLSLISTEGHGQREIYELAAASIDALSASIDAKEELLYWFEIRLAELLGIRPQLAACVSCDEAVQPSRPAFFSAPLGGALCEACSQRRRSGLPLGHDVLAILRAWQADASPRSARVIRCSAEQASQLGRILTEFLKYHLDRVPESRYTALHTLLFRAYN